MIHIGTDIESVQRVQKLLINKPQILKKFYFDSEWNYSIGKASPAQSLTGIWCAKEAVIKAIYYYSELSVFDIEITRCPKGIPKVVVHNNDILEKGNLTLSISHTKEYATSTAIFEFKNSL